MLTCLVAIDEEINSMMKIFESDLKRLNGIMVSYKETKSDLTQNEIEQRTGVIDRLRESYKLFKNEFDD